ncbi:MAG: hypothetical protein II266_01750 [Clostridia bacterium]|nr:hypothetical protein [Clostridia bacterium]
MAFDWTQVEGYREGMSADEMVALLANFTPKPAGGGTDWKAQYDKSASEIASLKKQLKERMTDDERKEAERAAADAALKEELETLRRERAIDKHKASFMAQKYDAEAAEKMAKALVEGKTDDLFALLAAANGEAEKRMRAELLKATPTPPNGKTEKDDSMTTAEKLAAKIADKATAKSATDVLSHYI